MKASTKPTSRAFLMVPTFISLVVLACAGLWRDPNSAPTPSATFTVYANQGWQDTGFSVVSGDVVEIEYLSGLWSYWSEQVAPHDASGDPDGYICMENAPALRCTEPVPNSVKGSLVAHIGDMPPLAVGNYSAFVAPASGSLKLAINDTLREADLADNVGSIVVRITISKSE